MFKKKNNIYIGKLYVCALSYIHRFPVGWQRSLIGGNELLHYQFDGAYFLVSGVDFNTLSTDQLHVLLEHIPDQIL